MEKPHVSTLQSSTLNFFKYEYIIFLYFGGLLFGTAINPYLVTNLGLLFFMLVSVTLISRYSLILPRNPLNVLFSIFILYDVLHLLIAAHFISLTEAWKVVITLFTYVALYGIIQSYTFNYRNIARLNLIFALVVFGESLLAVLQHFSENFYVTNPNVGDETSRIVKGYDIFSYFSSRFALNYFEARGTFGQKNQLGAFLVLLAPFFICLSAVKLNKKVNSRSLFYGGVALFSSIALYFSYSRSAWVGFAVSLVLIALYAMKGRTKLVMIFGFVFLLVLILINNDFIDFIYDYVFTTDATLYQRFPFWQATIEHINATPFTFLFGYSFVSPYIVDSFYHHYAWTPAGHNSYLTLMEAKGFIELVIVLTMLFMALYKLLRVWKEANDPELRSAALGFAAGIAGLMVSQLFDHKLMLFTIEINIFLVVIISLTVSYTRHLKKPS
ncbi:MAG: O-antigen ligase family protein [Deferribacteres bacterium]|nr:O-antigen ligase family protein [candidate division KSB1 bacterium]MCB9504089.1 O-antigen ligase family protein [Deferribacteres bacterium]